MKTKTPAALRQRRAGRRAQPLVALAFPPAVSHFVRVLKGVLSYARRYTRWQCIISENEHSHFDDLAGWNGDGIIGLVVGAKDLAMARSFTCPVVNISGALADAGLPRVRPDYFAAGKLAAEHLLDRRFRCFAFHGIRDYFYSMQHKAGFLERLRTLGLPVSVFETALGNRQRRPWQARREELERWLRRLQPPVGLYCVRDECAVTVVEACRRVGLRVPQDVAIIGYDNNDTICELCDPPLTSITPRDEEVGFEAARLLDGLMSGRVKPAAQEIVVPVGTVVLRNSTDTVSVEHPALRKAVEFMHQHYARGIDVKEVAAHCGRSRRWLELQAHSALPGTLRNYLNGLRLRKAKSLLATGSDLLLKDMARVCGFSSVKQMVAVFRRLEPASLKMLRKPL
ncbi:MAG: DNA-binding transcriptional regulator [Verrucomicrobiia bacterium]|jgi:LacI family transcriptional regulator